MGNKQAKGKDNFFGKIKDASSYRDFVIKMNKLISAGAIEADIDTKSITAEELNLYLPQITNFYCFVADFLFENSMKKETNEKGTYTTIRNFFLVLSKLSIYMANNRPLSFYELLWQRVNYECVLDVQKNKEGEIEGIFEEAEKEEDREEYIGREDQLTVGSKILVSALRLLLTNGYGVKYEGKSISDIKEAISQMGWIKSLPSNTVTQNRIALMEFIISMVFIEKKFMFVFKKNSNAVINLIRRHDDGDLLFKSFLLTGVLYDENGVIPYSGYFYKNYLELNLYESALCLNLSLFLTRSSIEVEEVEWTNEALNQQNFLLKKYLAYSKRENKNFLEGFFKDSKTLNNVLSTIPVHMTSFYEKNETLLPFSYRQVGLEESLYRRDGLSFV